MSGTKNGARGGAIARLIIWILVLVLVGGIFTSLMLGGNVFGFDWSQFPVLSFGGDWYDDTDYNKGDADISERVSVLDIDWVSSSVSVKADADAQSLTIRETNSDGGTPEEDDALRWRLVNGRLTVKFRKPYRFAFDMPSKSLEISIPAAWLENMAEITVDAVSAEVKIAITGHTDEISVDTVSGSISINGECKTLSVNTVSGPISVNGECDTLSADTVSGKITFVGAVEKLELDSVSGDMNVTLTRAAEEVEAGTVSGDLTLTLPADIPGFTAEMDSVSGSFETSDFSVKSQKDSHIFGDGSMEINMDSTSGDLTIRAGAAVLPETTPETTTETTTETTPEATSETESGTAS